MNEAWLSQPTGCPLESQESRALGLTGDQVFYHIFCIALKSRVSE